VEPSWKTVAFVFRTGQRSDPNILWIRSPKPNYWVVAAPELTIGGRGAGARAGPASSR